ncbi:MAG: tetratricopeptide repeat protein [Planctomycetes bacterium]|nr:tetratricopeptide repeat protein [Planctomycetota bacterium]
MLTRYQASAEQWREVLSREPEHPEARGRLAVVLYYLGDTAGAWAELHSAEAAGQDYPPQLRELLAERMREP